MLHTQPCPPMRAHDTMRGAAGASRARARLAAGQAAENLTPVEFEVSRSEVENGEWMSQDGDIRDLVSVWPRDGTPGSNDGWIKFRVKLGSLTAAALPPGFLRWDVTDLSSSIPDNTLETPELHWQYPGLVQFVTINVGDRRKVIPVDVPDVGSLDATDVNILLSLTTIGVITLANSWAYSEIARSWSIGQTTLLESQRNALKHAGWMALSASDFTIGPTWALIIGEGHEKTNRKQGSYSYESTMDLYNNEIGTTLIEDWLSGEDDPSATTSRLLKNAGSARQMPKKCKNVVAYRW